MPNTLITPTWVTKDAATFWKNNLKLVGQFDRQYDSQYKDKPKGAKIGYSVQARLPNRFVVSEGQSAEQQALLDQVVNISVNHQYHVDMGWSSADQTMSIQDTQKRYTRPAGIALANKWDAQAGQEVYKSVYMAIGTPGTRIATNDVWTDGIAKLQNAGVPQEFVAVIDPKTQSKLLSTNFALFNPAPQISKYFRTGQFGAEALGVDEWYYDQNLPMHTTGSFTSSSPAVNGASQTGTSLIVDGFGTFALKTGDVFTLDGVNAVNPLSYVDTGDLQQFVLTADFTGSTSGTMSISPSIITSGALQTVTASPANDAAISFLGSTGTVSATMTATKSKQSLIFHSSAFAFVMADLQSPLPGAESKRVSSEQSGISIRYSEQWNAQTDQTLSRLDTLGGIAVVLPYFAMRAYS